MTTPKPPLKREELIEHIENWIDITFSRGQNTRPPFDKNRSVYQKEAVGKIIGYFDQALIGAIGGKAEKEDIRMVAEQFMQLGSTVECSDQAHKRELLEARIDELENISSSGHGGGNWRRILELRKAYLEAQLKQLEGLGSSAQLYKDASDRSKLEVAQTEDGSLVAVPKQLEEE